MKIQTIENAKAAHTRLKAGAELLHRLVGQVMRETTDARSRLACDMQPHAVDAMVAEIRDGHQSVAQAKLDELVETAEAMKAARGAWNPRAILSQARLTPAPKRFDGFSADMLHGSDKILVEVLKCVASTAEHMARLSVGTDLARASTPVLLEHLHAAAADEDLARVHLITSEIDARGSAGDEAATRAKREAAAVVEELTISREAEEFERLAIEAEGYIEFARAAVKQVETGRQDPTAKLALGLALAQGEGAKDD